MGRLRKEQDPTHLTFFKAIQYRMKGCTWLYRRGYGKRRTKGLKWKDKIQGKPMNFALGHMY